MINRQLPKQKKTTVNLLAVAYVSQQNLVPDDSDEPIDHPAIDSLFDRFDEGRYLLRREHRH